jgi:hypothetical protein
VRFLPLILRPGNGYLTQIGADFRWQPCLSAEGHDVQAPGEKLDTGDVTAYSGKTVSELQASGWPT